MLKLIAGVTEKIRQGQCSGELANYFMTACVGGILNYPCRLYEVIRDHRLRDGQAYTGSTASEARDTANRQAWGVLYHGDGAGLGWFNVRGCISEAIITEGWIAATIDTLERRLLRDQWQGTQWQGTQWQA